MSRSGYHAARVGPRKSLYPGFCAACGEHFPIGTPIARKGDTYIHASCAKGADES